MGQTDPAIVGQYSARLSTPYLPIHAHMLPTGKVMFWDKYDQADNAQLWDPATGSFSPAAHAGYNIFCTGFSFLANGHLLVTGGHVQDFVGLSNAADYNPFTNTWTPLPNMNAGRWYPTGTTLPNGNGLVVSGQIDTTVGMNPLPQVWQVSSNTWQNLTTAQLSLPFYPYMYVAPNGKVFEAGPNQTARYLDTSGTGAWTTVADNNFGTRTWGSSAMYDSNGKVMIAGGTGCAPYDTSCSSQPTNSVEIIDLSAANPSWKYAAPMAHARKQHNTTLLPDGKVLVTGGSAGSESEVSASTAPVYAAEMWDPASNTWTSMASLSVFRGYHSVALLLPDGRVFSGGGNFDSSYELFSPPYLFKGARPTIASAPTTVNYGQSFFVGTSDASSITKVSWLALGSVTHTFNAGQRINFLQFAQASGGLNVTAPANPNLCPPGYYMMFILNGNGVPSVAKLVQVGALQTAPNAVSGLTANASNGRVTLNWTGSGSAETYNVQRSTTSGGPYTAIASGLTATRYVDTGVTNGTTYYYVVITVNSQNQSTTSSQVSATPTGTIAGCPACFTIWPTSATPGTPAFPDSAPVELGVNFRAESNGSIVGMRFYKGVGNTGTHIGNLWTTSGTRLATATFSNETASGWQQVMFANPVQVAANTTYIASYFAPNGYFALDSNYFASAGVDNSPLFALSTPASGGNGVFTYSSASTFPTSMYSSSNYWVDVIYQATTLAAPTGLTATGDNAQIALSWNAVSGAASYSVRRATVSGGPYTAVGTPTATSFTDTGLSNNTTYYYVIAAVNSSATSANSAEASATPAGLPTAPTGVTATPGNAQIALSWTAVSGATSYKVQRSTTSGGPYTTVASPTATSYTDTALTNGTTYYYVVAAVNSAGTGPNSTQASATPTTGLPTAPTGATATAGNAQVALSWSAVSGATSYKVQRSTTSGGPYATVASPTGTSYTDAGLTNGIIYYYVVAAVNSAGTGPNSTQVSAMPTAPSSGPSCPPCFSIWSSSTLPGTPDFADTQPVELGVAFQTTTNGYITSVRFYKGTGNTGTHIGNLWTSSGTHLATATFTGETASGWQQVNFAMPVAVTANTTYVASYFSPNGHFALDGNYFGSSGVSNSALRALSDLVAPVGNGVFAYNATSRFPNSTYNASNYWVDVVFQTTSPQGPSATVGSNGQASLSWTAVSGAASYNVKRATVSGGPYTTVSSPATTTYTDASVTRGATYYYVVTAVTSQGESANSMEVSAIVPPATAPSCPCSTIWNSTSRPGTPALTSETLPVELGVVFQAASNGYIMGIRFYKGTSNTGTHIGHLWSSKGTLLASATFTGETTSGWQQVNFTTPVPVIANTTYVASYFAPAGNYARDGNYFASAAVSNPPLSALSNAQAVSNAQPGNGTYVYSNTGTFPIYSSGDGPNYWVDVVFKTAP